MTQNQKIIAVVGATGQQGGSVLRALKSHGQFRIRALTRNPEKHPNLADEVVTADLDRPESLSTAFEGAYGVFVVTNFWDKGGNHVDEIAQGKAAIDAAKAAGVEHFIWSTLPDVEAISHGKYSVPHFTGKATVNRFVTEAHFRYHTFIEAPFYFQNLTTIMPPQPQEDGTKVWALPVPGHARCIHMGDITELGGIVAGAFAHPDQVGQGEILSLCGSLASFDDVVGALRKQGHQVGFQQVPAEVFAKFFPGADEMVQMLGYFQTHTYMGPNADEKIARARAVAPTDFTDFATWARTHFPVD